MRFMVLVKDSPEVIDYAERHSRRKFGNGADLIGWRSFISTPCDKTKPIQNGIALYCKGSILSYLWHKTALRGKTTVRRGWFTKQP